MYKLNKYKFGTHQIIAKIIGHKKKRILDIGCNKGYLKKITAECNEFTGIDFDPIALKVAGKGGYVKTYLVDLNSCPYKTSIKSRFDLIIFADLLEHLIYPQYALNYFIRNNLAEYGQIIVSLPNVANFTTRFNLLFGVLDYSEAGILDKTHLHLYTRKSARKMLEDSDLKIISEYYSSNTFGLLINFFPFLSGLLAYNLIYVCEKNNRKK